MNTRTGGQPAAAGIALPLTAEALAAETTNAAGTPWPVVLLIAAAAGFAVASIYYVQPLLDLIAAEFGLAHGKSGLVFASAQIGYGAGLLALVPLGDMRDRRGLILAQMVASAVALSLVAISPSLALFLAASTAVGASATVAQLLVAHAFSLCEPGSRGRVLGVITAGIITGVVMARVAAGTLSTFAGWRGVFGLAAAAAFAVAGLLYLFLPAQRQASSRLKYAAIVWSVAKLLRREHVLRVRAGIAFLTFCAMTIVWTPLVLELRTGPWKLGHAEIGLFGLSGLLGTLGAAWAGRMADRRLSQWTTGSALVLMVCAWLPIALVSTSLWGLMAGLLMIDFALQAAHVSSQSRIFAVEPEARSRIAAGYMLFYALGCAVGAVSSTLVYARAGWIGVCALGAMTSTVAFVLWAVTRHSSHAASTP